VAAPTLRADAARNLELILEAADEAFAEQGHEACVADIATRAGVGQATIFRRFET
jgi:AcrR family transcriptional regulator